VLTEDQLARLIETLTQRAPPVGLAMALRRCLEAEPETLAAIVRCLLAESPSRVVSVLEWLANRNGSLGSGVIDPDASVFRRAGDYWEIQYDGRRVLLRHGRGLGHLARLLARPGERVPAKDLVGRTRAGVKGQELARISVTKAIGAAIGRLTDVHPKFGMHLAVTIRRGISCAYLPDPRNRVRWIT